MTVKNDVLSIISLRLNEFIPLAENLGRSRFLLYKSDVHAPDESDIAYSKEDAEMDAIAESFRCEIVQNGNSFSLFFYMNERDNGGFLEIVDAGMPAPYAGGNNGISTNPDGSTYTTPTPKRFWDTTIEGYAKPATGVINEIRTMLQTLFHSFFVETIEMAKTSIMNTVKTKVAAELKASIGG